MTPVTVCAIGGGFTAATSTVLGFLDPALLPAYAGACVVVYGVTGAVVAVREGWVGKARQGAAEGVSWATGPSEDGPAVCESCLSQLAVHDVLIEGRPFAVCHPCTPPTPVVLTVVSS